MVNLARNFFVSDESKTKTLKAVMQIVNNVFKICVESECCIDFKKINFSSENTMGGAWKFILDLEGFPNDKKLVILLENLHLCRE